MIGIFIGALWLASTQARSETWENLPIDFHGVRILNSGIGNARCDSRPLAMGPYSQSAVVFVTIDAVEESLPSPKKPGISLTVRTNDKSIINVRHAERDNVGSAVSLAADAHFFLKRGRSIQVQAHACPTGEDASDARRIESHFVVLAIAAPAASR
jgi:hypothetical protein